MSANDLGYQCKDCTGRWVVVQPTAGLTLVNDQLTAHVLHRDGTVRPTPVPVDASRQPVRGRNCVVFATEPPVPATPPAPAGKPSVVYGAGGPRESFSSIKRRAAAQGES